MLHNLIKLTNLLSNKFVYIDIPNENGVYEKWLICDCDKSNQFLKYLVVPCEYNYHWIAEEGRNRIKHSIWGVSRSQSSYNSGIWTDYIYTTVENQDMTWLPLNSITEYWFYTHPVSKKNQRIVVSAPTENPIVWKISKVISHKPIGVQKITLYQDIWNEHTDYIETDENGNIIAMYADYYDSNIEPIDPDAPSPAPSSVYGKITASTPSIKVGGSYKTLTLRLYNSDNENEEVTDSYSSSTFNWSCYVTNGDEMTDLSDLVTWLDGSKFNQKKIKFLDNRDYLGKLLNVKCTVDDIETVEQFELIV